MDKKAAAQHKEQGGPSGLSQTLIESPRHAPVNAWACFGVFWAMFYAYILISWVTGPYFKRVLPGPSKIPDWQLMMIRINEPLAVILFLIALYYFVIRPVRREGKWTSDALFFVCFMFTFVFDPMYNYIQLQFTYNSHFFNMGSWVAYIPGFQSIAATAPGRVSQEPLLAIVPSWGYALYPMIVLITWVMRKTKALYSNISNLGLFAVSLSLGAIMIYALELPMWNSGFWCVWSVAQGLLLFPDSIFKIYLPEVIGAGMMLAAFANMRYYLNDKGENFFERGIESLRVSQAKKTCVRFLALMAGTTCLWLCTHTLSAVYSSAIAQGVTSNKALQEKSYCTNYICGPETDQACPSANMPNSRRGDMHFDPQGRLVIPEGVAAPGTGNATEFK